ncbi:Vesicle transport protein GOT1A [Trichoplax sp. H2]|nr:Vesicle transport protein GOT1A [Trichoplax sp. H2]|eukprot:RDD43137.1 Vesicle transport protein GOT1A [Trichoplax sp. H2]
MLDVTDTQKIGIGVTAFGMFFLFLGMLMLFDKALLAVGNILFLSGIGMVIGLARTYSFFFQRHKMKGTVCFFLGIVIVIFGWPVVGMVIEAYGFFLLFRQVLTTIVHSH